MRPTLADLIHYVGQTPLRAGRVALAVICWCSDFEAYARLGHAVTGHTYICWDRPGHVSAPRNPLRAAVAGWRLGAIEHRLLTGALRRADAEWLAERWNAGVPV